MARTKKDLDDYAPPDREYYPVDDQILTTAPPDREYYPVDDQILTTAPPSADDLARQQRRAEQKKAKEILQTGGRYAAIAGGALVKGAEAASSGISRYAAWVERKNAEALDRQEQEQKLALERRKREVERRKAAMEIQREQQELAREERRFQLEMAREEAKFRREFGDRLPQQGPPQTQGPSFGFSGPQQEPSRPQGPQFGYGLPQPAPFLNYGPAFGTPAPGFRSPAEIFSGPRVGYESGGNPRRSAPGAPGRKKSAPKKRSPR
jgi:hypothetical protein